MALVDCPDCGRKVSARAEACPACAHPIAAWNEADEAKSVPVAVGAGPSRARENRRVARLVVLETPAPPIAGAARPARPAEERRAAPTYRFVCHLCGEDEVFSYCLPPTDEHVCGTCEEAALVSGVERRRLLHWWPIPFVLLLLVCAAAFATCRPL